MTSVSAPLRREIDWGRVVPLLMFVAIVVPTAVFLVIQLFNDPALFFQTLMKSLALGSVYAIIALGFVLIFKATQTVNFAQGALAMVGALFLSFMVADEHIPLTTIRNPLMEIGGPDWIAWALSAIVALAFGAVLGLLIERLAIRPMIGKPLFSIAVITLGLEAFFRTFANDSVKISFRAIDAPWEAWNGGGFTVGDAFINWSYVAAIITALICFVAVYLFFRTRTGVAMRAVAFDQEVAMAQGISVARVFAFAWAAGMVLASIGGIFATQPPVAQTGAVQVETQFIAFRALPAVILGGLDSVAGALVGGLIVGAAEIFAGQYASGLTDQLGPGYPVIVPYVVMIIGLLVRPYGLFGTPEIRRV